LQYIDTASDLIGRFGQTGNAYIILTRETGLPVYAAVPHRLRHRFIDTFLKHPKHFAGIAGSPLISRIIKVLDRYGLVSIFLPIIFLAIVMTMLPDYLFWILVIWVSAWIIFSVIRLFKK
jgi:hypothetical protein